MNNKKFTLFIVSGVVFTLAISGVVLLDVLSRNSDRSNEIKTPYQLYCESHPQYNKTESEWLNDLINGRLGDKEKYVVSFDSAGGSKVDNQVVFVGEKVVEPEKPTKLGYEFVEWTYKGNPWIFYGFSVDENIVLTAKWSINHYSIDYVLNGGSTEVSNPIEYTVESEFTFESPTREGYGFAGWYDQNNNKFESISKGLTGDLVLTAKWTADKNNLNIISSDSLRGDVEVISGEGYTDEEIKIAASSNSPYAFKGWYDEDNNLVSKENPYTFTMPADNVKYYAVFDELKTLSLTISDDTKGSVSGSGDYIIGDEVTVECNVTDGTFKGWFDSNDELVSSFETYTFEMPSSDYELHAVIMTDEEEEQYNYDIAHGVVPRFSEDMLSVTYGMYPQSVVSDEELIAHLEELTLEEGQIYYEYNGDYYIHKKTNIYNFARYYDLDGVILPTSFEDGTPMVDGAFEWFKAEPITWDVVSNDGDEYHLMSRELLEKGQFHTSGNIRTIDDQTVYANNYSYSNIRKILNGDLFNIVFILNDDYVIDTLVDNSAKSTGAAGNIYACEDTVDKIYLPSVEELSNLPEHISSTSKTTDYLRSNGVYYDFQLKPYYSDYWTRSPDNDAEYIDHAKRMTANGRIGRCSAPLIHCLRPCLTIKVK